MTPAWYVVEANPKAEFSAAHEIAALGIEVYLPKFSLRLRRGRRSSVVYRPMLCSYLFARFPMDHPRWPDIFSRRGVRTMMVDAAQRPKPVPDDQIAVVREIEAALNAEVHERVPLTYGQVIDIIDGKLAGYQGFITRADHTNSVSVKATVFGRSTTVTLPREHVRPLAA
jgi:transcription antitermination factor NusG